VGIAPPYHFTEHVTGFWNWAIPGIIILSGSYLNYGFTRKTPLILGWLGAFALQAVVRSVLTGAPVTATLLPMTGVAFILFTFYMISDPGTVPTDPKLQVLFGASVAVVYSLLVTAHVVFGIFFSLLIVCTVRGLWIYGRSLFDRHTPARADARQPAAARGASS
jgi:enediyne biosynthesis protein E5